MTNHRPVTLFAAIALSAVALSSCSSKTKASSSSNTSTPTVATTSGVGSDPSTPTDAPAASSSSPTGPRVLHAGSVTFANDVSPDLDALPDDPNFGTKATGESGGEGHDITYQDGKILSWGATIVKVPPPLSLAKCMTAKGYSTTPFTVKVGTTFCAKTKLGDTSLVRVAALPANLSKITLDIKTYTMG